MINVADFFINLYSTAIAIFAYVMFQFFCVGVIVFGVFWILTTLTARKFYRGVRRLFR
jgi:hypothetical protein